MTGFKDLPENDIDFVNPRTDPYRILIGRYVIVDTSNRQYAGVYRGLTNSHDLVLQPSIVHGTLAGLSKLVWENDYPLFVSWDSRNSVGPSSKEVIEASVKEVEKRSDEKKPGSI